MNAILRAAQRLTTPLMPDDYLSLVDPLWVTTSLRARVIDIERETASAVTLTLQPSRRLRPHLAGQHLRLGVDIDGVRQWRSYSITSVAPDGGSEHSGSRVSAISVTVQGQHNGVVSTHLTTRTHTGDVVALEEPQGDFHLPSTPPEHLLLFAGGSGVTPLMGMVRTLRQTYVHTGDAPRVDFVYSARDRSRRIFADELTHLDAELPWLTVHFRDTARQGRLALAELDTLVPGWRDGSSWACGPVEMVDDAISHWQHHHLSDRLHTEKFHTLRGLPGDGGRVSFTASARTREVAGGETLLEAGEAAGILMPHGCRMGICHNCVLRLDAGQVKDTRTGEVHGEPGDIIQTCVSTPATDLELRV